MKKIIAFFGQVREIFREISWPKKDTLIQSTVVVISISVILSLILGGFDFLFVNTVGAIARNKNKLFTPASSKEIVSPVSPFPSISPNSPTPIKKNNIK